MYGPVITSSLSIILVTVGSMESKKMFCDELEMFYLNTIEQLFLFVQQLHQLEESLPYSSLLSAIPILAAFKVEFK